MLVQVVLRVLPRRIVTGCPVAAFNLILGIVICNAIAFCGVFEGVEVSQIIIVLPLTGLLPFFSRKHTIRTVNFELRLYFFDCCILSAQRLIEEVLNVLSGIARNGPQLPVVGVIIQVEVQIQRFHAIPEGIESRCLSYEIR